MAFRVEVHPDHREEMVRALVDDAAGSTRDEPGTRRFDVIRDETDPNVVYFYEAYESAAAFEAHRAGPYYEIGITALNTLKERGLITVTRLFRGPSLYPPSADDWGTDPPTAERRHPR
jgi:quinol monooxygenase YgiN